VLERATKPGGPFHPVPNHSAIMSPANRRNPYRDRSFMASYGQSSIRGHQHRPTRQPYPYTPGAGRRPEKLAGRDADLRDFAVLVNRLADGRYERSMVFSGLRGVGKTVLLLEFDVIAREAGWISSDARG
jgi:hypothetical protein